MSRDVWKHPAAAGLAAWSAFPRRRRDARETTGQGGKERKKKGVRW
jgi:hypothetical protein